MIPIKEEPEMLKSDLVAGPTTVRGVRRGQDGGVDVHETLEMTSQ